MRKIRKRLKILIVLISAVLLFATLTVGRGLWENDSPTLSRIKLSSKSVPSAFAGYKIAQISDLHNCEVSEGNYKVIDILKDACPDIIVVTGDLIDSRKTNIKIALDFIERATEIAPVYYANGNHESRVGEYVDLKRGLINLGVTVVENQKIKIIRGDSFITLIGITDPSFYCEYQSGEEEGYLRKTIEGLIDPSDGFRVVLSHRPEYFYLYKEYGLDLVFSGHAHGGQFILPLIGGLYAPGQGAFPDFTQGLHTDGKTNLVISRGVGNSAFPFRLNNRPEVVLVEL